MLQIRCRYVADTLYRYDSYMLQIHYKSVTDTFQILLNDWSKSTPFRADFNSNLRARLGTAPPGAKINSRPGIEINPKIWSGILIS